MSAARYLALLCGLIIAGCGGGGGGSSGPIGTIGLSASTYTVAQTAGSATIAVNRTDGSYGGISVNYATSNGTAVAGTDYTATSGTLTWSNGDSAAKTFAVTLNATPYASNRTFTVTLSNAGGGATLGTATATVTVNAPPGNLGFASGTYSVSHKTTLVNVIVSRASGGGAAVAVNFATANGSAIAGTDYVARSGTLNWASGDVAPKAIPIVLYDTGGGKSFTVTLSNITGGATLGTATTTVNVTAANPSALSIKVQGTMLIDGDGNPVQLRGVSYSGYEFAAFANPLPTDPSGSYAGQTTGPSLTAIQSWHANALAIPLNEASWDGGNCITQGTTQLAADPSGTYKASVTSEVQQATAAGLYVVLELEYAAPGSYCPTSETQMANSDHTAAFWTSVATAFKGNPAVLFEVYKEPYFYGLTSPADQWAALLNGGTLSYFPTQGDSINITTAWNSVGMQSLVNTVRATGATNVLLITGVDSGSNLGNLLANMPNDSANQLAVGWSPYPPTQQVSAGTVAAGGTGYAVNDTITLAAANSVYAPAVLKVTSIGAGGAVTAVSVSAAGSYLTTSIPTTAVAQSATSGTGTGATFTLTFVDQGSIWVVPANWPTVQALSAKYPVVVTDTGEMSTTSGSPFLQQLLPAADSNNWSVVACCWDIQAGYAGTESTFLISTVTGTPTGGYGQVLHDWIMGTAWQ
jgi:hypothetical protein